MKRCVSSLRVDKSLKRRGVTLLEVLFAIGVVAVGLLGVFAVVPVALNQVGQGQIADAGGRAAQVALREFEVRSMANATLWRRPVPNFPTFPAPGFWSVNFQGGGPNRWGAPYFDDDNLNGDDDIFEAGFPGTDDRVHPYPLAGYSFCLDPLFLAELNLADLANSMTTRRVFPYVNPTAPMPRMLRVSLAGGYFAAPGTNTGALTRAEAERIFTISDDLVTAIPEEAEDPPIQVFQWAPGPDGSWGVDGVDDNLDGQVDNLAEQGWIGSDDIAIRRENEGAFSWMATLVPKPYQAGQATENYTLSIVVFHRRNLDADNSSERLARIQGAEFFTNGISGGDVVFRTSPFTTTPAAELQNDLELDAGDWVLLAGQTQTIRQTNTGLTAIPSGQSTFRWYRVANTDSEALQQTASEWLRDVTLEGPDWPVASIYGGVTHVVIMPDVITVLERDIRIQTGL